MGSQRAALSLPPPLFGSYETRLPAAVEVIPPRNETRFYGPNCLTASNGTNTSSERTRPTPTHNHQPQESSKEAGKVVTSPRHQTHRDQCTRTHTSREEFRGSWVCLLRIHLGVGGWGLKNDLVVPHLFFAQSTEYYTRILLRQNSPDGSDSKFEKPNFVLYQIPDVTPVRTKSGDRGTAGHCEHWSPTTLPHQHLTP